MARRRYIQAVNDALAEEMERNPDVIIIGEDVELAIVGDMRGLHERFGPDRVRNTPISEATLTGMALGATAAGYHVVLHMMFANFIYTGFDAIANQITKMRLMTGGQLTTPLTIIAGYGGGGSTAAQHSDSVHPALANLGGINVLMPSNSADAKGLLKTALRSPDPCVFLEARTQGGRSSEVPDGEHLVPFGAAATLRQGRDVSIVALGSMVAGAVAAAELLAARGIDAEVVDLRTLVPLDESAIVATVGRTGRLVVVDESRDRCGAAAHIAAVAADKGFGLLRAPVKRVNIGNVAIPFAHEAETTVLPAPERIADAAAQLVGARGKVDA
jgi:acetoin:2,6-dichlorophenolindophenol oxidoreductase subunit beta